MRLDRETLDELNSPHARIANPLYVGLRLSGIALAFFAVASAARLVELWSLPPTPAWWCMALISAGIMASGFAYAYLGAWYGRRMARRLIGAILAVALLVGLYALTRYTNPR